MATQQLLVALVGLLAVDIAVVNCHFWQNQPQHYSDVVLPQRAPLVNGRGQQNNIEIVEGTIDQLNRIDPTWICTNRRTGDQMIFGTEIPNGNFMNNGYPQHNSQMGQVPNNNPWLNQRPNQGFVTTPTVEEQQSIFLKPTTIGKGRNKWADVDWTQYVTGDPPTVDEQQSIFSKPTTIEKVRNKWADFDWTQYVTVNPTTIAPENEPNVTPPNRPHAGEGIIQARNGV